MNIQLDDFFSSLIKDVSYAMAEVNKSVTCKHSFPPTNIILKKNKDLVFEFAIAGYDVNDIYLSFEDDTMILEIKKKESKLEDGDEYIFKGIKESSIKSHYYVPSSKYDTSKTKATMKNGVLKIEIPKKEEAKAKLIDIIKE